MMKTNTKTCTTSTPSPLTPFNRLYIITYSLALLLLLYHHLFIGAGLVLAVADAVLAAMWLTTISFKWRPVHRHEQLEKLENPEKELPAMDVFICTADPRKEPPAGVVSCALSALAFEYPGERLSVYVSDDGGSEATFYAFVEAGEFARRWLPFCRENGVRERSPEVYFQGRGSFGKYEQELKIMYEKMKERIEIALERGFVGNDLITSSQQEQIFKEWKNFTRNDHPSVIQVILESSKDFDIAGNAMPNLIYVSREKRPSVAHHFKAGALNALTRVSSAMTNAPMVLTLDCDTCSNDPQTPHRALCYFTDPSMATDLAYVQFPQNFQGINKNDIYASAIKRLFIINAVGMDGLKGPNYVGTGCFFVRKALHTSQLSPQLGNTEISLSSKLVLEKAHEVAGCRYEEGTKWGSSVGFRYGSLVEDFNTGYHLQCEGWKSVLCNPKRPAFIGDVPKNLNDVVSQQKRWVLGLYEVSLSRFFPLTYGCSKASLLTGLAYAYYALWGIWCIPISIYTIFPQLALTNGVPMFPKATNPWFYLYAYLFVAAYTHDLIEFVAAEATIMQWWNDQRMWLIRTLTACLFGTIQISLKQLLGISLPGFNVTSKVSEVEQTERYNKGQFDFGVESPFFVVLTTVAIINLCSFAVGIFRAVTLKGYLTEMFAQLLLSSYGVVNCLPIYKALFLRKDQGKIQWKVKMISFLSAGILHYIAYLILRG